MQTDQRGRADAEKGYFNDRLLAGRQAGKQMQADARSYKQAGRSDSKILQRNIDDLAEDNGSGSVYMYEWLIGESGNR